MISIKQMRSLISDTCMKMGEKFGSDSAVDLVLATGIAESRYEYIRQMGDGPARSFWQVEPATCVDNLAHYLKHRPKLIKKCADASMVDLKHWQNYDENLWANILEKNIAAGIIHCRLKYWRVPKKMPSTLEGQANYWKKYYNSELGAGDPEHFVEVAKKWLR
jgi:4-diphosphocytidyl-2C-methyl-D-erythritol kinase